jgi:hypothetical protein
LRAVRSRAYRPGMTPPRDREDDGARRITPPVPAPLAGTDAARFVAHLTGMTPDSALTFAGFHSGLRAAPRHDD